MSRRSVAGAALVTLVATMLFPSMASGDEGGYDTWIDSGNQHVEAHITGTEQMIGESVGAVASPGRERVCRDVGEVVPCVNGASVWQTSRACYVAVTESLTEGRTWGAESSGYVMSCTMRDGSSYPFWQATPEVAPPPPDPRVLARRAVDAMRLQPIRMGTFPESSRATRDLGYVGWNMWMWAERPDARTWGPLSAQASLDGYSVRATATVDRVVWEMGNGDSVTCQEGTPWQSIWTHNEPSPDCGYVYSQDGEYLVTATSHWIVEWSGIGESGSFTMELSESAPVRIAEVQVLNVAGP